MEDRQEKIISLLKIKLEEINTLTALNHWSSACHEPQFEDWHKSVLRLLEEFTWDKDSSYVKHFYNIYFEPSSIDTWMSDYELEKVCEEAFDKWLKTAEMMLKNIINEFEILWAPQVDKWVVSKKFQDINVINNIEQKQVLNINIENTFKNELTVKQYEKLNEILQEKNEKTKWEKIKEFLLQLWSETLAKILKDVLLWNLNC